MLPCVSARVCEIGEHRDRNTHRTDRRLRRRYRPGGQLRCREPGGFRAGRGGVLCRDRYRHRCVDPGADYALRSPCCEFSTSGSIRRTPKLRNQRPERNVQLVAIACESRQSVAKVPRRTRAETGVATARSVPADRHRPIHRWGLSGPGHNYGTAPRVARRPAGKARRGSKLGDL